LGEPAGGRAQPAVNFDCTAGRAMRTGTESSKSAGGEHEPPAGGSKKAGTHACAVRSRVTVLELAAFARLEAYATWGMPGGVRHMLTRMRALFSVVDQGNNLRNSR